MPRTSGPASRCSARATRATPATSSAPGTCARSASTPTGARSRWRRFGPGEIFGELAIFDEEHRSATIEALEETEVIAILAGDMRRMLREHPDIAVKLLAALSRRLRETNERLTRQSFQTVQSRVAAVLAELVAAARSEGAGESDVLITATQTDARPARRLIARVREPLSGRARAGRDHHPGPRQADRARPGGARTLCLLSMRSRCRRVLGRRGGGRRRPGGRDRAGQAGRRRAAACWVCPRAIPTATRRPSRRRGARSPRRPASRGELIEELGDVEYRYERRGRTVAKRVRFYPVRVPLRRPRRPRPRDRGRALDGARAGRRAS